MLRYFNLWLIIGWLLVLTMCYLSLIPKPPNFNIEFTNSDKIGHFSAYFVLMFWFSQLYKTSKTRLLYILFFILMGATLEVLQGLSSARTFEYADMLANTLGAGLAWFITRNRLNDFLLSFEAILTK